MTNLISKSLFEYSQEIFKQICEETIQFNSLYNGENIIQDDIFNIIKNYVKNKNADLQVMFLPIKDDDLCAFTCFKKNAFFIVINSCIPLSKQIFAAAHELYHIYSYFENDCNDLIRNISYISSSEIEESSDSLEEKKANAFAASLLIPSELLTNQIRIYHIEKSSITVDSVIQLADIFAVPYKAMVLRLYEEGYIDKECANKYINVEKSLLAIKAELIIGNNRWENTNERFINIGSLNALININEMKQFLSKERIAEDRKKLDDLLSKLNLSEEE